MRPSPFYEFDFLIRFFLHFPLPFILLLSFELIKPKLSPGGQSPSCLIETHQRERSQEISNS
jgi:hypothetical protein